MSSIEKHQRQYESNREFIESVLSSNIPKNDWVVTAAFYSALHLVDKTIVSSIGEMNKPRSHVKRNEKVGLLASLTSVRSLYLALYIESRKSRYDCITITDVTRDRSMYYLGEIEKLLNK